MKKIFKETKIKQIWFYETGQHNKTYYNEYENIIQLKEFGNEYIAEVADDLDNLTLIDYENYQEKLADKDQMIEELKSQIRWYRNKKFKNETNR